LILLGNDRSKFKFLWRMATDDEEALIAKLRNAFPENIRSRSEAANVRINVAAQVNACLVYDDDRKNVPTRVLSPKKEITGIRRRYLEALKTNIKAREHYQRASVKKHRPQTSQSQSVVPREDTVLSHLELCRLEKYHKELDIHRRYVNSVSQDASTVCNLGISQSEQKGSAHAAEETSEDIASIVAEVAALTSKLQKAVLQASYQLERQKQLLAKVEPTQTHRKDEAREFHGRAIAATRDVLITWLDEKLSEGGTEHSDNLNVFDGGAEHIESSKSVSSIAEHYEKYLAARQAVIEAANEALQPLCVPPQTGSPEDEEIMTGELWPNLDDTILVHNIRQRLVPLLQHHATNMALRKYSSLQTAKERQETLRVLGRLAEESHLLSTYPAGGIDIKDELARHIAAWVSAANASSASVTKMIEKQYEEGIQALGDGEAQLAEWRSFHDNRDKLFSEAKAINRINIHGQPSNSKVS
jgi:hypothetical protein